MTSTAPITEGVAAELEGLRGDYDEVSLEPDGEGGAIATVGGLDIGEQWMPRLVPISFQLAHNAPHAAIYPWYTVPELAPRDGAARPQGLQVVSWRGCQVTQISLRHKQWDPGHDTASGALAQVVHWLREAC